MSSQDSVFFRFTGVLILYILSLFFMSYIFANCIINFNRENLFITGVMCQSSLFCYFNLSYMYYYAKNNEFKDDADKYGVMLLMTFALQGIPMLCFMLSKLLAE